MGRIKLFFFTVILMEGYVVLATELLAIRQLIPFVGNGTETIAIVIAAVLMPLSVGYFAGGRFKPHKDKKGKWISVRERLIRNIIKASIILAFGMSYLLMEVFFSLLSAAGLTNKELQTLIYSALVLVYPVFLLGQTVPLVSNYFKQEELSKITGQMLFFSTVGSFLGSIISTIVLMTTIGVHNTVILTTGLLVVLVFMMSRKLFCVNTMMASMIAVVIYALNNTASLEVLGIIENNNYSTIAVREVEGEENSRILDINRSWSSKYSENKEEWFPYHKLIDDQFIDPILKGDAPKEILIIGAGGFTVGVQDTFNNYTYVDIDPTLKEITEKHFHKKPLSENKRFVAQPARAFLKREAKQYDMIFLNAFSNVVSTPFQLITVEFFEEVKAHIKPNGIMLFNVITSPTFEDDFSQKLDTTIRQVFPFVNRQPAEVFDSWNNNNRQYNVIYSYTKREHTQGNYTDDKNSYFLDR